ncbi:MAG: hypothetical protein R6U29_03500, partial [Desulfosudaceae bacterium]
MDLNEALRLANNFFYTHTYLAIGIVVALVIITCWRPKQVLKILLTILAAAVIGYFLYYLGQAMLSGMSGKENLI